MSDQRSGPRPFGLWTLLSPLAWWVRRCQTQKMSVSAMEKFARAILMLPAFSLLLILLRLRLRLRGPITVDAAALDGARFTCHPPDLIQMYLWLFGVWEPDLTHYIRSHLKAGDVFIDVGANIGYDTVLAARCVSRSSTDVADGAEEKKSASSATSVDLPPRAAGSVIAIEASPEVFAHLQQTIALNNLTDRVRLINKAASDKPGAIQIYAGPQYNTGLTTTIEQRGFTSRATIEALPLDELLTAEEIRRARLIKIDVEGAEPQVLGGMKNMVAKAHGVHAVGFEILIELSPLWWSDPAKRPIDVLQPLLDAGFHLYEMKNNYWPWRYLWPNDIAPIRRCTRDLTMRVKRIDLVLSMRDVDSL